jgi:peroxiredoxin
MQIDDAILDSAVSGVNLIPGSLRDQLGDETVLLIFLRFFGCIFCRETTADLRALSEDRPDFPTVIFVSEAKRIEIQAFVRRYWPQAKTISDPQGVLYSAFGVGKSLLKSFSPSVFRASSRALDKGNERGPVDGNIFRMPGAFLVHEGDVVWSHEYRHSGELPDFAHLPLPPRTAEV